MKTVAAVVVNWNGGVIAAECAASLARQTLVPKLYVVDNGSSDGSVERILEAFPAAIIIRNSNNHGYAAANNQALVAAWDAEYILLLNNDAALPDPTGLAAAIQFMDERPDVHGVCGRFEYPSGEFQPFYQQLPSPLDLATVYGFGKYFDRLRRRAGLRRFLLQDEDFTRPFALEQPAFACVLARGECVRAVGLMNEDYPIFFNDVDYCWRWRDHGWAWQYLPSWRVVHHKGKSTYRLDQCAPELMSSAVRFARQRFSLATWLAVTTAVVAEALWKRFRHGDQRYWVRQIAAGQTFFAG